MLDYALELWEYGYNVIPLGDPSSPPSSLCIERAGGDMTKAIEQWPKTPRIAWKQYLNNPADDDQLRIWWLQWPNANIGILTGNISVVDADSADAVEFVKANVSHTPRRVATSKGMHFYFNDNPELDMRNTANAKSKIDVRGAGGYVVAPPSLHASGKRYEWETDQGVPGNEPSDLPQLTPGDKLRISGSIQSTHSAEVPGKPGNLNIDVSNIKPTQTESPVLPCARNVADSKFGG